MEWRNDEYIISNISCSELSPIDVAHVTALGQFGVHTQSCTDTMRSLCLTIGQLEVIPKDVLVVGMYTVLDDGLSTLLGALTTQVGYTLFGDDDIHIVFRMVFVRHHGYNGADFSLLGH